jgi:hypothetical protein
MWGVDLFQKPVSHRLWHPDGDTVLSHFVFLDLKMIDPQI